MHAYRTHTCGQLRAEHVGNTVRLSGWVHRKRDLGGLLFIDLRDHYGITQCVVTPSNPHFRPSWSGSGSSPSFRSRARLWRVIPATVNAALATGEIDLKVKDVVVLSEVVEELPLPVFAEPEYPEDVRLKYRFLDLRRETLHANIVTRTQGHRVDASAHMHEVPASPNTRRRS